MSNKDLNAPTIRGSLTFFSVAKLKEKIDSFSNPRPAKKVLLPPELSYENTEVKFRKFLEKHFFEYLENFQKVLEANVPKENLKFFYKNITSLKIGISNLNLYNFIHSSNFSGFYILRRNKIKIKLTALKETMYHELLHMATTYVDGLKVLYCGFSQESFDQISFCDSINEGYTELLNSRYFLDGKETNGYRFQVTTAKMLERIIGMEKMQNLFFTANLQGLIDELKVYASEEDIMKFIANSDYILKNQDWNKTSSVITDKITKCYHEVNVFILNLFYKKLKMFAQDNLVYMQSALAEYDFFRQISTQSFQHSYSIKYSDYEIHNEIFSYILTLPNFYDLNPDARLVLEDNYSLFQR